MKPFLLALLLIAPVLAEPVKPDAQKMDIPVDLQNYIDLKEAVELTVQSMAKVESGENFIRALDTMDARLEALKPINREKVDPEQVQKLGTPNLGGLHKEFQGIFGKIPGTHMLGARTEQPIRLHVMGRILGMLNQKQVLDHMESELEMLGSLKKIAEVSISMMIKSGAPNADKLAEGQRALDWITSSIHYIDTARKSPWLTETNAE